MLLLDSEKYKNHNHTLFTTYTHSPWYQNLFLSPQTVDIGDKFMLLPRESIRAWRKIS